MEDIEKFFTEHFGRKPDEKETGMLKKSRISKQLFKEWLEYSLKQVISMTQVDKFIRKYKEKNGAHWSRYDIFVRETQGVHPDDQQYIEQNRILLDDGKQVVAETKIARSNTPTVRGINMSSHHSGSRRRSTEDKAMRKIVTSDTLKDLKKKD